MLIRMPSSCHGARGSAREAPRRGEAQGRAVDDGRRRALEARVGARNAPHSLGIRALVRDATEHRPGGREETDVERRGRASVQRRTSLEVQEESGEEALAEGARREASGAYRRKNGGAREADQA